MSWAAMAAITLAGCNGNDDPVDKCPETGPYACKTGETEPLYAFQWALNYAESFFQTHADAGAYGGGMDLNVEPVHRQGIKGQGVKVLVIDSGTDLGHEDLKSNADYTMSWNFESGGSDPTPLLTSERSAHGTNVAGIIGAAQNGIGVMGIAPRVTLGGAALILRNSEVQTIKNHVDALGGAPWSSKADIFNGSYGGDSPTTPAPYAAQSMPQLAAVRSLKGLRNEKGIVFVKASGNSFDGNEGTECGPLTGAYDCTNPANDTSNLEPNVIVTAALNAKGQASSYSSAGSVVWITGMGGEFGKLGRYGELSGKSAEDIAAGAVGDGPTIFSTDIRSCTEGYSVTNPPPNAARTDFIRGVSELIPGVQDNPNCDYDYMNGTSSATPTISGVVALVLSANPDLTWRDVRDILRLSARNVDIGYEKRRRNDQSIHLLTPYGARFDLTTNTFTTTPGNKGDIAPNATQVPVELGWEQNAAGLMYSNWYGFGVPDAAKAVALAQLYAAEPSRSRSSAQIVPPFKTIANLSGFDYQKVTLLSSVNNTADTVVDELQVRLSGSDICLGSLGIAVQSPAGTVSILKMPLDHYVTTNASDFSQYGLGSYAFYGESAKGTWNFYALASNPVLDPSAWNGQQASCDAAPADGLHAATAALLLESRVIPQ